MNSLEKGVQDKGEVEDENGQAFPRYWFGVDSALIRPNGKQRIDNQRNK